MDASYVDEMAGRLRGLLVRLGDRLSCEQVTNIAENVDANEFGLALEQLADDVSDNEKPVTSAEWEDMLALADRMKLGHRVYDVLRDHPER